ncbi:MAG: ATP-binding protein [Nitrospirae bacterium]|nr:ATP-binding protein [Nitrospirota bacterium]
MDELLNQITLLNKNLERIADSLSPSFDGSVLDCFMAFKCSSRNEQLLLKGIAAPDPIAFAEIIGIDDLLHELRENTEQFLQDLPCNNALLYGPRGTGKSSAVKALLNAYATRGLRMVEMPRDSLSHILDLADIIRRRPEKFIVFCDDLTFDEDERSYRQIKTVLEGGLETRPSNMLIYATSNRRHLIPELIEENQRDPKGELHPEDALEEKISLSDRFGLRLGFQYFDFDTYFEIVGNYAKIRKLRVNREELRHLAMQWSISGGSFSGRTARQFIDSLEGRLRKKKWKRE